MKPLHTMATAVIAAAVGAASFVHMSPGLASSATQAAQAPGGPVADSIYTDEIADYGVCRGVDPSCYHDWGGGYDEGDTKRILVWSRTAGPRHAHLGTPLGPGLNPTLNEDNVAQSAMKQWAEDEGIAVDYTEDLASFTRLSNYQAVVFLSSNRDTLDDTAQTSLKQYLRSGGGFVGIHNAFGAEYSWEYYEGLLGGANFFNHGPNRDGTVEIVNGSDVSTSGLPSEFAFKDEWYNLNPFPSFVNVLAEVDAETSLSPSGLAGKAAHGEVHPVSWCHYYDGGRAWLTTLGHDVAAWTDAPLPGDAEFKEHVVNGLLSAMGVEPFCAVDGDPTQPTEGPTEEPTEEPTTPPSTPSFSFSQTPSIAGQARVGKRVRLVGAVRGNITPRPTSIDVRWFSGNKRINGADRPGYTVRRSDLGNRLKAKVTVRGYAPTTSYTVRTPRVGR